MISPYPLVRLRRFHSVFAGLWIAIFFMSPAAAESPRLMRVVVPVTDIRSEPKQSDGTHGHDPLQETQLLFGEEVLVYETRGEWMRVSAPGQMEYTHHRVWEGYPGWVKRDDFELQGATSPARPGTARRRWISLYAAPGRPSQIKLRIPLGSRLEILRESGTWLKVVFRHGQSAWVSRRDVAFFPPEPDAYRIRIDAWKTVRRFIGTPYYWGGLSPRAEQSKAGRDRVVKGVDCSGLTHVAYRMAGVTIPRDSHEQWMKSKKLRREDLKRGDLVFLANAAKPDKIVHVMMYVGGEFLIEGPGTGARVRRVTFKKKLGQRLGKIESGDRIGEKIIYFGRPYE